MNVINEVFAHFYSVGGVLFVLFIGCLVGNLVQDFRAMRRESSLSNGLYRVLGWENFKETSQIMVCSEFQRTTSSDWKAYRLPKEVRDALGVDKDFHNKRFAFVEVIGKRFIWYIDLPENVGMLYSKK